MIIELPFRIASKKNSKRIIMVGRYPRLISSKQYLEFETKAIKHLRQSYPEAHFDGFVYINYLFYMKGKIDADTDNMEASINDVLEKAGIITNDKYIVEHHAKKIAGAKDFRTVLEIIPLTNMEECG